MAWPPCLKEKCVRDLLATYAFWRMVLTGMRGMCSETNKELCNYMRGSCCVWFSFMHLLALGCVILVAVYMDVCCVVARDSVHIHGIRVIYVMTCTKALVGVHECVELRAGLRYHSVVCACLYQLFTVYPSTNLRERIVIAPSRRQR